MLLEDDDGVSAMLSWAADLDERRCGGADSSVVDRSFREWLAWQTSYPPPPPWPWDEAALTALAWSQEEPTSEGSSDAVEADDAAAEVESGLGAEEAS